jgi:GntR family transcriptional regulator / MocR family aminotransferase
MRSRSSEVLIDLDRGQPRRLRAQVEAQLRSAIRSGQLPIGTVLPSSRSLADDLQITRGVIVAAYSQLTAEGFLHSAPGSATTVCLDVATSDQQAVHTGHAASAPMIADFSAGVPDLALFPRVRWAKATRVALNTYPDSFLGYVDGTGVTELRRALADYLSRVRGVRAHEARMIIGSGFSHAIAVLAETFTRGGHATIAVEDPHRGAAPQLRHARLDVRGVALDSQGISVEALRRTGARLVLVTPAHHAPTGIVLSPTRRAELVRWARDVDGYIIEDDYDAEFRYDHHPVGAMQGIAPDRVIYCGTTSKTLAPGIRLGWTIVPSPLADQVMAVRRGTDVHSSTLLQATFACFIEAGDLDRHLRSVRRVYRQRRDALVTAVRTHFPEATPTGIAAGMQTLLRLPDDFDEDAVVARAGEAGVHVVGLRQFRFGTSSDVRPALVLGYGQVQPRDIDAGIAALATAARATRRASTRV